jgi:DNA-directed RNA polymerase specialized sigma24 family protein
MADACGGSITRHYVDFVKSRDQEAAGKPWERYYLRLVRLARAKLRGTRRTAADEEDIALSAFNSFFESAARGRYPELEDRDGLWRLLVTITARKAADLAGHERRRKRGGGQVWVAGDLAGGDPRVPRDVLALVASPGPTPEFAALVAEESRRLLGLLQEDTLRPIALDRLAGYHDQEIAERLGCSRRTVMRRLVIIRKIWRKEMTP